MKDDLDGPWKEGLDLLLPFFFALCLPKVHLQIDWSRGYRALDGELRKIIRRAKTGRRHVDRLYEVWLLNGEKARVFIHLEVQAQYDASFSKRMMDYRCALRLAYGPSIASFAILADDRPSWRPLQHKETLLGSSLKLTMQPVKLLDFAHKIDELEASTNPFAPVILAHLKTQATRRDPETRLQWKLRFVRNLYERGFSAEQVRQLFHLIDWLMGLPEDLNKKVDAEVDRIEEEKKMPYVTGYERRAIKRAEARGGIRAALELRFGKVAPQDEKLINAIADIAELNRLYEIAKQAQTITEIRKALKEAAARES